MRYKEFYLTEQEQNRNELYIEFRDIYEKIQNKEITDIMSVLPKAKKLAKGLGRRQYVYGYINSDYPQPGTKNWYNLTVGKMIDNIETLAYNQQVKSGISPSFPTGNESSMVLFASNLARYFKGFDAYASRLSGRTWSTGYYGETRYKDPQYGIKFHNEEDLNDAFDILKEKGKRVYLRTKYSDKIREYVKIGKFLVGSNQLHSRHGSEYYIEIMTSSGQKRGIYRQQADITDQQAQFLMDIARTQSDQAWKMIQAYADSLSLSSDKQELQKTIDSSEKLDPNTKLKLDKIIQGAKDFKEPDSDN